ncbi:prephenate dehydrogenase [Scatolibacter rhodanostii]|uniref:prephenate dehydrogenase n=1 Tax=Scatolibacter rhodanostii TaxID=2014781 RepID=UPI000C07061E|nr:prephenate dehydrogenase [Scatolibacter rhodanostii]
MKKIVVVGLGLIGGSIAKALKRNTSHVIYGIDIQEEVMLDAVSFGVIDGKADFQHIQEADIIYLCTYPAEAIHFIDTYKNDFKLGCIITDTCGIKSHICEQVRQIKGDFIFVGAHPMAGKETSGFSASDSSIFIGASYIITPGEASREAIEEVSNLALSMGFGKIVITTPENHDRMIAFTSQVPHVIACSYVMSPACDAHKGFSAGSYRDVSRVADINAELWTHLFLENQKELVSELDILIEHLQKIRNRIELGEENQLHTLLETAAMIKRRDKI